jgi:hypothetical protein
MTSAAATQIELERAYRAIRGFWTAAQNGLVPDQTMLAYHSPTIGAACRFVATGELDGAEYFIGKPVEVLHEALGKVER